MMYCREGLGRLEDKGGIIAHGIRGICSY